MLKASAKRNQVSLPGPPFDNIRRLPSTAHTTLTVVKGRVYWAAAWWARSKIKTMNNMWIFHCIAYALYDNNEWERDLVVTIDSSHADIILAPPHPGK